jgi:hypothetical protein
MADALTPRLPRGLTPMTDPSTHAEPVAGSASDRRSRRYWDRQAEGYDRCVAFSERHLFADTRPWLCRQATGQTLEVAVGTGALLSNGTIGSPSGSSNDWRRDGRRPSRAPPFHRP